MWIVLVSFSREGKTEEESVRHQQVASKENNEQTEDLLGFLIYSKLSAIGTNPLSDVG